MSRNFNVPKQEKSVSSSGVHPVLGPVPKIMGIVNVTPDSFSDGGNFISTQKAIDHALLLIEQGAEVIDIGGESTRPGAAPVTPNEELERVLPVIEGLKGCGAMVSIDTYRASTMKVALDAGATMINDVSALTADSESINVAKAADLVCLMHKQGSPQSMQDKPEYHDVVQEVIDFLKQRVEACVLAGIDHDKLIVDPGIGFGKTLDHNIKILKNLEQLQSLGVKSLLGTSRKSFIEKICPDTAVTERLPGSLASALAGWHHGVNYVRVHDVAETVQAFKVYGQCL